MRSSPIHSCRWRGPRRFLACPIPPRGRWFGCSRRKAFCGRSPAVPGVESISLGRSCRRSRAREESSVARGALRNGNGKRLVTQQTVNAAVKAICDINDLIEAKGKEVAEGDCRAPRTHHVQGRV